MILLKTIIMFYFVGAFTWFTRGMVRFAIFAQTEAAQVAYRHGLFTIRGVLFQSIPHCLAWPVGLVRWTLGR